MNTPEHEVTYLQTNRLTYDPSREKLSHKLRE